MPVRVRTAKGQDQRPCPACDGLRTFTLYASWDRPTLGLGRKKQTRTYAQCSTCAYRLMDADPLIVQLPD